MIPFFIDVDGVQTDGTVSYPSRERRFSVRDGHGFQIIREKTNIIPTIISGETDDSIVHRCWKLNTTDEHLGVGDKYKYINENPVLSKLIGNGYIAISDDIPDIKLLQKATLAFCPADAEDEVKAVDGIIVLTKKGGEGCVREAINMILTQPLIRELLPDLVIRRVRQIT
jgi:YrbI family 3-deoxy-D-manno-octulosonate 8-phosphate phosphatase